jgi:hypothetical protein
LWTTGDLHGDLPAAQISGNRAASYRWRGANDRPRLNWRL